MFEDRIAAVEGTEDAFAAASGMAAVNGALTSLLKAGDHVVSARALFGSCLYILEEVLGRFGVKVSFVDGADLEQWRAAVTPATKAVFFESVSNPTLELVDIKGVAEIAHAVGATVIVDNVFATPIFSKRGRTRRRRRGLFGHQAYRRAGQGAGRRDLRHRKTTSARCWNPT